MHIDQPILNVGIGDKVYDIIRGKGIVLKKGMLGDKELITVEFSTWAPGLEYHNIYNMSGVPYNALGITVSKTKTLFSRKEDYLRVLAEINKPVNEITTAEAVVSQNQKDAVMKIDGRTQLYFSAMCDGTEEGDILLDKVFHKRPGDYVFRHVDCPLVFITDGNFMYAIDMDEKEVDPIAKYGLSQIEAVYNDYTEFVNDMNYIQVNLGRVIPISPWVNDEKLIHCVQPISSRVTNG